MSRHGPRTFRGPTARAGKGRARAERTRAGPRSPRALLARPIGKLPHPLVPRTSARLAELSGGEPVRRDHSAGSALIRPVSSRAQRGIPDGLQEVPRSARTGERSTRLSYDLTAGAAGSRPVARAAGTSRSARGVLRSSGRGARTPHAVGRAGQPMMWQAVCSSAGRAQRTPARGGTPETGEPTCPR